MYGNFTSIKKERSQQTEFQKLLKKTDLFKLEEVFKFKISEQTLRKAFDELAIEQAIKNIPVLRNSEKLEFFNKDSKEELEFNRFLDEDIPLNWLEKRRLLYQRKLYYADYELDEILSLGEEQKHYRRVIKFMIQNKPKPWWSSYYKAIRMIAEHYDPEFDRILNRNSYPDEILMLLN